ncbi:MAG TPA: sulfocyanin-like copper-binding protein, partial [Mycoplana sp.]|nr:sulfocyanin-like copper-binding protein [Mycoplana sp.]
KLDADLEAGTYLLFCNLKGHYEAGMATKLTVTP